MNTIKKLAFALIAIFVVNTASAQKGEWKEMKTFHAVMSKTFHPAEAGNLKPVKENSADLLAKAKEWQASTIPSDYKNQETTTVLTSLVAKCEELNLAVIAAKSDDDLKKLITEAHDIFHQIGEKCRVDNHDHGNDADHKKEGKKKSEKKSKKSKTKS